MHCQRRINLEGGQEDDTKIGQGGRTTHEEDGPSLPSCTITSPTSMPEMEMGQASPQPSHKNIPHHGTMKRGTTVDHHCSHMQICAVIPTSHLAKLLYKHSIWSIGNPQPLRWVAKEPLQGYMPTMAPYGHGLLVKG